MFLPETFACIISEKSVYYNRKSRVRICLTPSEQFILKLTRFHIILLKTIFPGKIAWNSNRFDQKIAFIGSKLSKTRKQHKK